MRTSVFAFTARAASAAAVSATILACSSSSSSPQSSSDCAMSMTLSGAVNVTFGNEIGCGNAGDSSLDWTPGFLSKGPPVSVVIDLASDLGAGQTGSVQVTDVSVSETVDGGDLRWVTPSGACSVTITSNASNPDPSGVFHNRYTFSGNGSCSKPAAADPTTGAQGTVSIGSFTFTGFIDPS